MSNVVEYVCDVRGSQTDLDTIADLVYAHAVPVRGKCVDLVASDVLAGVDDFGIDLAPTEKIGKYDWLHQFNGGWRMRGACGGSIVQFCEMVSLIFDVRITLHRRDWESDWCETRQFCNGGWRVLDCYREDVRADDEPLEWAVRNGEPVTSDGKAVLV